VDSADSSDVEEIKLEADFDRSCRNGALLNHQQFRKVSSGKILCTVLRITERCSGQQSTSIFWTSQITFAGQKPTRLIFSLFSADISRKTSYTFLLYLSQFVIYSKTVISTKENRQFLYLLIIHYQVLKKGQLLGVSLPC
jgi:hypothetical protein